MRNQTGRGKGSIEEDTHRLEVGIRQLKVQYDMFFAGALKVEPYELRNELERIIKRHSNTPGARYAQKFRFNALVSRFNSFSELWGKNVRKREEGDVRPAATASQPEVREQLVTRCMFGDEKEDPTELRRLHRRFNEANRRTNPDGKPVPFERFARGITTQTRNLREKSGCDQIEVRVVVRDDKVQLKARPGR